MSLDLEEIKAKVEACEQGPWRWKAIKDLIAEVERLRGELEEARESLEISRRRRTSEGLELEEAYRNKHTLQQQNASLKEELDDTARTLGCYVAELRKQNAELRARLEKVHEETEKDLGEDDTERLQRKAREWEKAPGGHVLDLDGLAQPKKEECPCDACGGTGKVITNPRAWLLEGLFNRVDAEFKPCPKCGGTDE